MDQWYWSSEYPNLLNNNTESIALNPLLDCDYLINKSGSNVNLLPSDLSADTSSGPSDLFGNTRSVPSDLVPPSDLGIIHDKISSQLNENQKVFNRRLTIYSKTYPESMLLSNHEIAQLHKHLLSLNENYDLRLMKNNEDFRMFRSPKMTNALHPTSELLKHIRNE